MRTAAGPGWYPDPSGAAELRYWDGGAWTDGVSNRGVVANEPLPPPERAPNRDQRAQLPPRAALVGLVGLVLGTTVAAVLGLGGHALGLGIRVLLPVVQLALWSGMVGACVIASRRYGTGSLTTDFGFRGRGLDVLRGLVVSWVARAAAAFVLALFIVFHAHVEGNANVARSLRQGVGLLEFALIAVVGAPIVEELFFRGLLLRSFEPRFGAARAVALQGGLFGLVHVNPLLGTANVPLVLSLAIVGLVFGAVVVRYRRLGPSIAAHSWFNLVVVVVIAATR